MNNYYDVVRRMACLSLVGILSACGGGGLDTPASTDVPLEQAASNDYFGPLPFELAPLAAPDDVWSMCIDLREKQYVRSLLDWYYLWPDQVQTRDPRDYSDVHGYFQAILAPDLDRFSYSISIEEADLSEASQYLGVGFRAQEVATGEVRLSHVEPNSPAALAGLKRGDTVVEWSSNLYEANATAPYYFDLTYHRVGQAGQTTVQMTPEIVNADPVGSFQTLAVDGRKVGYLPFESHFGDAQDQLIEAMRQAQDDGIQDLVLDLRYNGGGYLSIAASLASMLVPADKVDQRPVFESYVFNDYLQDFLGEDPLRFASSVLVAESGAKFPFGTQLPNLNLNRVYVLTSDGTCSASESVINGLRGIDVDVHIIGGTTCGKPYGMFRDDNCGNAFYPIVLQGVNAKGEGDYVDGFNPTCSVADDLDHERGDPDEGMLSAALHQISTGSCPVPAPVFARFARVGPQSAPRSVLNLVELQRKQPQVALIKPR